ncbi:MAG: lamin tail domain-containing protein [Verrucomicrobia bacterium]|nr:lamin tail domain-containing protein [Verrucomicrobiota bacterium]
MNKIFLRPFVPMAALVSLLPLCLHGQTIISEFLASNKNSIADADKDFSDWIELHNPAATDVNLAGWFLTDAASQLAKWRLPSTNLAANGYLVVFASGKDRAVSGAELHANFSLKKSGGYLALVKPDGVTIASEFAPSYPVQFDDVSYGRGTNGNFYFSKPTPGTANGDGLSGFVADTKFSQPRGFYDTPFDLTISTATAGAEIRYTTNGTPPSPTNGIVYTASIPVNATVTLRAAAFKDGFGPSKIDTHTYIFLEDVIHQSTNGVAPPGWPTSWSPNTRDYGMDPDVVNNPRYSGTIKNDLKTIPSFSIVMRLEDLFDRTRGIYANAGQDGAAWERPCSIELINPDGSKGFQIDAGIRMRGGFSRSADNPKHAFRFFFRAEYGAAKLHFPLFGDAGTDTFDAIDLRTFQNYSWSFQGDPQGVFIRDQFSRDTQLDMGYDAERGNYYHLYINGQYWGLYNTCERPEASYGATYFGGNKEDYDVIKVEAGPYTINATDGNMAAWTKLYNLAKAGLTNDAAYQRIQGNNPDGTPNPAYENLVDIPNLIDYMLVILYGGNLDAPISNFLGNNSPNNWYGIRNRNGPFGFRFFAHDAEHTLLDVNQDRNGPWSAGNSSVLQSSPQWIWQKLQANEEFRMRVADHVHRHFFNNGALTTNVCTQRFMRRKNEIDRAVVGESARWGDAKRPTSPLTRDTDWVAAVNNIVNNYFPRRTGIVLSQLKSRRLYPNVVAPSFNQHGGNVARGFNLTMTAPAGTIFYTLDGTDPRLPGGAASPTALAYTTPFALDESILVKSRVLNDTNWSALNEASFTIIQTFTELLITEIMYNPPDFGATPGDDLEFVELKNVAAAELDLSGVRFTNGIRYAFPNGTKLGPGQFVVLASNPAALTNKYPGLRVFDAYRGHLSNGGDTLALVHASGAPIVTLTYGDQMPWPQSPDGNGFSLVPVNPNLNPNPNDPENWRASTREGGSPGADDPASNVSAVWINEVLSRAHAPQLDAIELHNPTITPTDISYWYLTDDRLQPTKFRIPAGTIIPAGGYAVFTEKDFHSPPAPSIGFSLDASGEEAYLYSADAAGKLTGYSDGFSFGAAADGVGFGRYVTSTGEVQYPAQKVTTLGATNAGPRVGPIVFNEIRYHPLPGDEEFIELKNITASPVKLVDPQNPTNTWKIEGVGFSFPADAEIAASGLLVVVGSDPAIFRARNNVPASVPVLGPWSGNLQDGGERLQLKRPEDPTVDANGVVRVPFAVVDEVRYENKSPWPTTAAGAGSSLERINATAYGNDPINWRASPGPASPGRENTGNRGPKISVDADQSFQSAIFPFTTTVSGSASDDGLPNPPGALSFKWTQVGGSGQIIFASPNQRQTAASFPGIGTYRLRLTVDDGERSANDEMTISVARTPLQVTLVPTGSVWKYLDDNSDQGTAWRAPVFDDAKWDSGPAQLGYGDGDEATTLSFGPDGANKYVTTYFRRAFSVTNAAAVTQLTIRLLRDDGAVIYLNNVEVFRSNMPEGEITSKTFASEVVSGADETSNYFEKQIDPALLIEGRNVFAVEIHQQNVGSSDISFDLELSGLSAPANQPPTVNAGSDLSVVLPASATLNGSVADDGLPLTPGQVSATWLQVTGAGFVTFGNANAVTTTASFSAPGSYVLRLTASDGALSAHDDITVAVSGSNGAAQLQFETVEIIAGAPPTIRFHFETEANRSYTVQYRDSLSAGDWQILKNVPAQPSGQTAEFSEPIPGGRATRFYRLASP